MSIAGRCMAASTASGMLVGPGMQRNSRPLATVMLVLLPGENLVNLLGCSMHVLARILPDAGRFELPCIREAAPEALDRERRQVGIALAVEDQVGQRPPGRRREAEPAHAAAGGDVEAVEARHRTEKGTAVGRHRGSAA